MQVRSAARLQNKPTPPGLRLNKTSSSASLKPISLSSKRKTTHLYASRKSRYSPSTRASQQRFNVGVDAHDVLYDAQAAYDAVLAQEKLPLRTF